MKRRTHIVFLIPTLGGGGAERVIVTLAKYFSRERFRLTLAVVDLSGAVFREDVPSDVDFVDLRATRVRHALIKILALVWRLKPDVVFSTLGHLNLALAIAKFLFPPHVRTIARETLVLTCGLQEHTNSNVWRYLYRAFYRRHDTIVCQSQDMYQDLVSHYRVPANKAIVIHNPVDIERISSLAQQSTPLPPRSLGTFCLVAAGRLDHQKGFDLLINALSLIDTESVTLVLLGRGPCDAELKRLVADLGLVDRVHFAGFQSNPYPWFASADAFVLSSRYEGFPNVVLEALACGTPVIATPAPGGVREILDSVEGCVVAESITAEALALAITKWIRGRRNRVPRSATEPYGLLGIVSQYEELICRHTL